MPPPLCSYFEKCLFPCNATSFLQWARCFSPAVVYSANRATAPHRMACLKLPKMS
jgi:hypothetical protein